MGLLVALGDARALLVLLLLGPHTEDGTNGRPPGDSSCAQRNSYSILLSAYAVAGNGVTAVDGYKPHCIRC